jgi:CO/xanthine dehydrogenase FAD-binding subunit
MKIKEFVNPININDAYEQLIGQKNAVILGGGMFLRLQKRTLPLAIDLSHLGLNTIEQFEREIRVGAMVTLRQLETSEVVPFALSACTRQIAGVAVRNLATVGGSIMGRYPFSDVLTALMALKVNLFFHRAGQIPIEDFLANGLKEPDVLVYMSVPKPDQSLFLAYKPVYTDFSLINVSIVKNQGLQVAIGATPNRAKTLSVADLENQDQILDAFTFETDRRATGSYRRALAKALLEDAQVEVNTWK